MRVLCPGEMITDGSGPRDDHICFAPVVCGRPALVGGNGNVRLGKETAQGPTCPSILFDDSDIDHGSILPVECIPVK